MRYIQPPCFLPIFNSPQTLIHQADSFVCSNRPEIVQFLLIKRTKYLWVCQDYIFIYRSSSFIVRKGNTQNRSFARLLLSEVGQKSLPWIIIWGFSEAEINFKRIYSIVQEQQSSYIRSLASFCYDFVQGFFVISINYFKPRRKSICLPLTTQYRLEILITRQDGKVIKRDENSQF